MTRLRFDISMSLDGFVAGPHPSLENPLGDGGEQLHEWALGTRAWRESHGLEGGDANADGEIIAETLRDQGAVIMGRRMFSGGSGPWQDDPNAGGWWGDEPPFRVPVFVLTHHERERVEMKGGTSFTFVTDGIESALEQARGAAAGKDVLIGGGANVVQQYLAAGLVEEFQVHVAPVFLRDGVRLFEDLGGRVDLELTRVIDSPAATHLRYRVVK